MKISYLASLLVFVSLFIANNDARKIDEISEKNIFSNKVKVKNPDAQNAINRLKESFYNEKENIDEKYELKIKNLKKSRRDEVKNLKAKYRNRMKRLRRQYPEIPDMSIDSKPKPKPTHPDFKQKKKRKRAKELKNKYKDESK